MRNGLRALGAVAPAGNIRLIDFVVIVGGSGLDFELPNMLIRQLAGYGIVVGTANVRGPRARSMPLLRGWSCTILNG